MNGQPRFPGLLAAMICGGFIGVVVWLAAHPGFELSQAALMCVSTLAAAFMTIVNYIWGSSQGSRDKDAKAAPPFILESTAEQPKAPAKEAA